MKKTLILVLLLSSILSAFAQNAVTIPEKATATWPFLYEDFMEATILMTDGSRGKEHINLNLLNGEMQFIRDGEIRKIAPAEEVKVITVAEDQFIYHDKSFYQLVKGGEMNLIQRIKGNMSDLVESTGAYGTQSTVSATNKYSTIDLGGINNMSYTQIKKDKLNGKQFDVEVTYFFLKNDVLTKAAKKGFLKLCASNKKEAISFLKSNKINFKNEQDLLTVLEFLEKM